MEPESDAASRSAPDAADRSIVAEGLVKDFGDLRAVGGVDLRVPSGQIFGFLGPNGAGKSTVVKMLTTILRPTEGRATVAGLDVGSQQGRVRRAIGVALQEVGLDPLMTARESLVLQAQLFGASAGESRGIAERLLATVGLDDVDPAKRIGGYSGGMKRRLDLALALAHDPLVLFLDEPTTGLDPASRAAIWDEVRRLNVERGMTIFLTTQYLEEADRLADDIAIIDHGRIVAQGSPADLKRGLGDEVVDLSFDDSSLAGRAAEVLAGVAPQCRADDGDLRCYFPQAAGEVPQIVRALDQAGLPLRGLTVSRPSLDDVFLRATGARLTADDGGGASDEGSGGDPTTQAGADAEVTS